MIMHVMIIPFAWLYDLGTLQLLRKQAQTRMTGLSRHRLGPAQRRVYESKTQQSCLKWAIGAFQDLI